MPVFPAVVQFLQVCGGLSRGKLTRSFRLRPGGKSILSHEFFDVAQGSGGVVPGWHKREFPSGFVERRDMRVVGVQAQGYAVIFDDCDIDYVLNKVIERNNEKQLPDNSIIDSDNDTQEHDDTSDMALNEDVSNEDVFPEEQHLPTDEIVNNFSEKK